MKKNKYALILGGSSGMGKEMAKRFLKQGYPVKLVSKNEVKLLDTKMSLINETNGTVETMVIDLHNEMAINWLIDELRAETRHIKYLLNAAGFFKPIDFLVQTKEDYNEQMDFNKAFFFITQAVANNMKENGGGAIVVRQGKRLISNR